VQDVQFVIVGSALQEPDYDAGIRKDIRQMGLERNVRFIGTRTDVGSLLKQSDVFCLPSRSEGMSNALLEAMACGLPCVATAVGGNLDVVVNGQTGFLVHNEDYQALAARIVSLLRDRHFARSMGQEGRRIIEAKFTVQHMMGRLASLYRQLLLQRGLLGYSPAREAGWAGSHLPDAESKDICGASAVSSV
jgi:glycosyltransferase involved in cell wall biosynthesis